MMILVLKAILIIALSPLFAVYALIRWLIDLKRFSRMGEKYRGTEYKGYTAPFR